MSDPSKTASGSAGQADLGTPTRRFDVKVLFAAGVSPIVRDRDASIRFYRDVLGLPLAAVEDGDYIATDDLDGLKHLGLWPLSEAAEACFGSKEWPADVPEPQATVEFDVDDVDAAAAELQAAGYTLLHEPVTMPWGQRITHVMSPEHLLVGITYTPWMREGVAGG
jgi:catechol 2,3-dioxygenase-like lactoylglutathione lyase family enzyme